jgi:hypothetical protein
MLTFEQDFNFTTDFLSGNEGLFHFGHGYEDGEQRKRLDASTFLLSVQSNPPASIHRSHRRDWDT